MTLKSGKVYSDIGAPNNTYGVDGDIYMQLDGLKTTYRKEGAVWVAVGSSLGAIPEFISGSGVPSSLLGADNQYYRNVENQDIYYKGGGLWSAIGNLQGLAFRSLLIQHGIGKDLNTAPNYIDGGDLDDYITQGEFFASSSTLNRPFNQGGPIKVWRFDELEVYQQGQGNSFDRGFATRASSDGGASWSDWKYIVTNLATTSTAGLIRKATQGELNAGTANKWPDAATILNGFSQSSDSFKLPEFIGGWKVKFGTTLVGDIAPFQTHTTNISGFSSIVFVAVGGVDLGSSGVGFTIHRKAFNNTSVTVKFDEFNSGLQDCGYWWLAIGY